MIAEATLLIGALALAYAGAAMLALAKRTHWSVATDGQGRMHSQKWQSLCGTVLLLLSMTLAIVRDGWSFGMLLGPLLIGVALASVIATLTIRPKSLRVFALPLSKPVPAE